MCVHIFSNDLLQCSSSCHCSEEAFNPVCGSDGVEFRSPCHAGCQSVETDNFSKVVVRLSYSRNSFLWTDLLSHIVTKAQLCLLFKFKFKWCVVTKNWHAFCGGLLPVPISFVCALRKSVTSHSLRIWAIETWRQQKRFVFSISLRYTLALCQTLTHTPSSWWYLCSLNILWKRQI